MKKFLLLLFIATCCSFIYLKVQILGDANSSFNMTTRYSLGKYSILRDILGLHSYGDARNWYLSGNEGIVLEVVQSKESQIDDQTLNNFAADIKMYTGKNVSIFNTEQISDSTLSDSDLEDVAKSYRHHVITGAANLFVIYANDYKRKGQEIAKTVDEYGIVLSDKRLKQVTANYPQSMSQYVESTLLHEFGHQLGLEHNDRSGCIMNAKAEDPEAQGLFDGSYTVTKFCDYELNQLNVIKAAAN